MGKKLSGMALEELWQLFPVFLTGHKACWADWYREEETSLKKILSEEGIVRISHIGSTSIPGIWAKPIIDILVEAGGCNFGRITEILVGNGYLLMAKEEGRMSFNKGYTENGFAEKVYHVHVRHAGDNDELYFRDYLAEHPEVAAEYERMKIRLWKKYEHDRDGYTNAKNGFVSQYTGLAKELYGNCYDRK
ncbi:MAG: GrpB family protein [Lachnospiraceae bacterium]|nr:GrpB family protein [Lachnospiraceae bacterium]